MDEVRIMRTPEVVKLTGLSRVTIWRFERRGQFPQRRQLGENSIGWLSTDIEEWIISRSPTNILESGNFLNNKKEGLER